MLIVEAFAARDYKNTNKLKYVDVNVPALFPLKPNNGASNTESIVNIYKNKLAIANTVTSTNFISLPIASVIPKEIKKGHTFILISPDANPYNGVLITKYLTTEGPSNLIPNYATPPANPTSGTLYFNTVQNKPYIFNNSQWVVLGGGEGNAMTTEAIITAILQSPDYKLVTPAEKATWNNKQDKLDLITQADAEAGTDTVIKGWSAERVKQAITIQTVNKLDVLHGGSGGAAHSLVTSGLAGFMSPADKIKLDDIEAGATADMSPVELLTALKTVDGSGSGLDSDLLDGQSGSYYLDWANVTNKPDPVLTLAGDATGTVTFTDLTSATLTVTVANDSHTHGLGTITGQITTDRLDEPTYVTGGVTKTSRTIFDVLRGDRTSFLPADQIIIEQSTDAGVTWTGANYSDLDKRKFFTGQRPNINIPLKNGVKNTDCMLRVTITGMKYNVPGGTAETNKYNYWNSNYVTATERYFSMEECWLWLNANSDRIHLKIENASGLAPNVWNLSRTAFLNGWSGGNYVNIPYDAFGGGTTQTTNKWNWRFTFRTATTVNDFDNAKLATTYTTTVQSLNHIKSSGKNVWTAPNNYAYNEHLYGWDEDKNALFPSKVSGTILKSWVPQGTAPLEIVSTTLVSNLNADLLDGQQGSYYSPISSPTFTGTPNTPTASLNTNTTQIASTAFVKAQIANDAAPLSHVGSGGLAHALATSSVNGFMSKEYAEKLDSVGAGAELNQNAFSFIAVSGQSNISADLVSDTLTLVAGSNITITTDPATDSVTISGPATYTHPTTDGSLHVPATGTTNNAKFLKAGATAGSLSWSNVTATDVGLGNVTNESKATMFNNPSFTGTISGITATTVGLGNVTNESKATMFTNPTFTGTVTGITATTVGLGNVTNESKATMFTNTALTGVPTVPTAAVGTSTTQIASTAFVIGQAGTASPLMAGTVTVGVATKFAREDHRHPTDTTRAPLASPTFTGTVGGITAAMVGLGNVTNESKATMFTNPTFTGTVTGVTATTVGLSNVTNESKTTMFNNPNFTGKVGIMDSTPDFALDVNGDIRVQGSSTIKYGGTGASDVVVETKYNSVTKSLDFIFN